MQKKQIHHLSSGLILKGMAILIVTITIIKVVLASVLATTGSKITHIEEQRIAVEKQNILVKEKIASLGSLTRISEEASKIGFVKTGQMISLTFEVPIALR